MTDLQVILSRKGTDVATVEVTASVSAAVEVMNERHIGSVIVTDAQQVVGIFTERDCLSRVVARARAPNDTQVGEVMTTELVSLPPTAPIAEAIRLITDWRLRHLPVVDAGRLVGLVSIGDLMKWLIDAQELRINDLVGYITYGMSLAPTEPGFHWS